MTVSGAIQASGPDPQRGRTIAQLLIAVPILLVALCFAGKYGLVDLGPAARGTLIFTLLFALMVTGMPVSIALGLSVLTFLFTLTQVPIEAVALKLFTGIENFEIMAIPFFILAGNFLTHGGVARRMITFATAMVGHWYGGLGAGRRRRLRAVCRRVGLEPGNGCGHRFDSHAGHGAAWLSEPLRRRRHHHLGLARYSHSAVDTDGHLRRRHQQPRSASFLSPASCRA